jgi:HK97 family phage portal protein
VLVSVRECIALAIALQDNAAKFFGNGSRPGGVLEHPAALSEEAQERLRKQFEDQVGGKNLYRMMVLEEGLKYVAQRSENKDSQFDESRVAQDLNICRVFGVPPHKIGILNSQPRANVEQDNLSFIMDTVRPICVRWEQTLNVKLFTGEERDQGYYVRFDLNAILRGDMKSRYDAMAVGRQWGWLSANDCRELEELEPIEGGDIYLQPLNMVEAKKAYDILLLGKGAPATKVPPVEGEDTAEDDVEDTAETKPASK